MTLSQRVKQLKQDFEVAFGEQPSVLVCAPGRVNLIGEHTDYNDGFVLPAAIERDVLLAAAATGDSRLSIVSTDFDRRAAFDIGSLHPTTDEAWSNYAAGPAWALKEAGHHIGGARLALQSTIPPGAGLSSSAAIEVASALALQIMFGLKIDRPELARLCQRAENQFVGVPCGIMDQFIAALGRKDHALLLDCRSLEYEYVPVRGGARRRSGTRPGRVGAALVVANSGVKRGLVNSEYRVRRSQCEAAMAKLARVLPGVRAGARSGNAPPRGASGVRALRDVSPADLERHAHLLTPVELRRARHVVTEDERTLRAAEALKRGDFAAFGELMVASHYSLRDSYEVSCAELDLLVELALGMPGVYGSRMTGAGFGGCTVTLAKPENADAIREGLARRYQEETGIEPIVFTSAAAGGARRVTGRSDKGERSG